LYLCVITNKSIFLQLTFTDCLKFWNNDNQFISVSGEFKVLVAPNSAEGLEGAFVVK